MSSVIGTRLAAATDLPERGRIVRGDLAGAYRCAALLLQTPGGLADVIAEEEGADWPELNFRSVDVREYMGRTIAPGDSDRLASECRDAILDDPYVASAEVSISFAAGAITVEAQCVGDRGPFGFVIKITDTDGAQIRTF